MSKWYKGDNAINALREWKFSGLRDLEVKYVQDKDRLREECRRIVEEIADGWEYEWIEALFGCGNSPNLITQFNRETFISNRFCHGNAIEFPFDQVPISHLTKYTSDTLRAVPHRVLGVGPGMKKEKEMSEYFRAVFFNSLFHSDTQKVAEIWVRVCRDLMLMSKPYVNRLNLYAKFEKPLREYFDYDDDDVRISLHHDVPIVQTITFIRCIHPRIQNTPALVDALEGVFEKIFVDTMFDRRVIIRLY